jgi:hypothetical protein
MVGAWFTMNQTKMAKKFFESRPEGTRKTGRPQLRGVENTENVLRNQKVKRYRRNENNKRGMSNCCRE